jgi:hypothetical protein
MPNSRERELGQTKNNEEFSRFFSLWLDQNVLTPFRPRSGMLPQNRGPNVTSPPNRPVVNQTPFTSHRGVWDQH